MRLATGEGTAGPTPDNKLRRQTMIRPIVSLSFGQWPDGNLTDGQSKKCPLLPTILHPSSVSFALRHLKWMLKFGFEPEKELIYY